MEDNFLKAERRVIEFHQKVLEFGLSLSNEIGKIHSQGHPKPFSEGAFVSITADALALHQTIYSLCEFGRAFSAPLLLRPLVELVLSGGIIGQVDEEEQEYLGFKYTHFFIKEVIQSISFPGEKKDAYKNLIKEQIQKLSPSFQQKANDFIFNERMYGYWFSPEYRNPKDVIEKLSNPNNDLQFMYDKFSGAVHGGLLGLKFFKDKPDEIHPNPRPDKLSQNRVLAHSSRLLLELSLVIGKFEKFPTIDENYQQLISELQNLRQYLEK